MCIFPSDGTNRIRFTGQSAYRSISAGNVRLPEDNFFAIVFLLYHRTPPCQVPPSLQIPVYLSVLRRTQSLPSSALRAALRAVALCTGLRAQCARGKRSVVAVVNDSPVDCQSRDGGCPQATGRNL